ncbi:methyl-accepting chemotaxis protein [Hyphomicrobium sp. 99]|uniref:methyl-accepting chemotaxis protein n=1 Tax=Hyphomicrobium sp. 99 TaxID=1163419 RepID=UPI0005F7755C|nr:methyl-accepting chemotaxis protein [Hyphomicrobium sp. 99]
MVIGYINSKWSMPRRLALISAVFLIPSLAQLYLYAQNQLEQISTLDREISGGKLASAVWTKMSADENSSSGDGELAKLSDASRSLGVQSNVSAFQNARTPDERVRLGVELLDLIATSSGLAADASASTYYAQEVIVQRLPGVKQALIELKSTLDTAGLADDQIKLAINYAVLRRTTEKLRGAVNKLLSDSSTDAKNALGDTNARLLSELDLIAAKLKAADYRRTSLGSDVMSSIANANSLVGTAAGQVGGLFDRLSEEHSAEARSSLYRTLGLLIAATVAALIMVSLIAKGISLRLSSLVSAMDQLSHKDLSVEVPYLSDSNENGMIARALARFKEAVIENKSMTDAAVEAAKQQQEQSDHYAREHERFMDAFTSAAERIATGDFTHRITEKVIPEYEAIISQMNLMMGQLEAAQAGKLEAENQINTVVASLGTALSELAQGNLETTVYAEFGPEFAKLKADFNSAASQLKSTIELVKKGASSIKLGTEEISQASDDLSRRTENQAASLEETAAAVKEITDTVNKTARGATHARETVSVAKADAEKSGEIVRKAISAMNGIESSSKQISQIIGVIDEIAFQTNLLALNAGVEAARAGDAGRGFAVVASEVRALAQRSAEAAKEIKGLISASTGQVAQGVQLVGETGLALTRIVTQVAEINTIVTDIAASANEQAHGLEQVNTAVNEMDQVTQQNAAMVEEATAATQTLAQQTEELVRLVSRFRTGDDTIVDMSSRRDSSKPAARAQRAPVKAKMAAAAGMGRRSVASSDAGWEEF